MEKTISLATPWKRAPLALAVTMALGSPALQAQTHIPSLLLDPGIEQIATPVDGKELVIIDGNVEDMATLLKALPYGAEWLVLDSGRDGVVQLAEIASRHKNIRALHLLSHGEDGLLKLGNSELNQQNLTNYRNQLNTLAASMAPGADLLLYGCEVAKTAKGEQFIRALKAATGLDVVASNDVTRDGDWELEVAAGAIDAATLTPEGYAASLDIIAGDGSGGGASGSYYGANGGAGGGDNDTLTGTANPDVMFGDGSGGGGSAYHGPGFNGYGGAGGAGADTLHGGAGDDILFGDGFDGLSAGEFAGGDGGFGGGGGGGSYYGYYGGVGGLFAGDGGNSYGDAGDGFGTGDAGGNGTGSLGGAGATGSYSGIAYGGGGGGWSDGSGAGNGATANTTQYGVAGVDGSVTPLTVSETGGIGSQREVVKSYVNAGYFTGLASGDGADTLNGGSGSDDLFGLGGADIFQFEITDAPAANGDIDTIHDFVSGTDTIQLLNLGAPIGIVARDNMLSAQTAAPTANDRTLVYTEGSNQLTIVVLGVGNNLTALDVPAVANTAPTVNPSIDGSVAVGGSFTVTENGFDIDGQTLSYSYQWKADGIDILGETGSSFTPTAAQAHALITVAVTADDGAGGSATATSASVTVANSNPIFNSTPAISGSATYGSTLSIVNTTTTDADSDSVSLSYQWLADGIDIFGATGDSYTLTQADAHALITARVTANDGNGGSDIMTTAAVMIANSDPTFTGTPTISGSAAVGSLLSVSNTATSDADGDTTTLGYQWQSNGVDIVGATSATFTPTADQAHTSITVIVTADDGNGGSTPVTTAGVTVANSDPSFNGTPTITGSGTVGSLLSISNTATTDIDTDTVTLSYQWHADGVDIIGATGDTYTLTQDDAHALITVTITADDGNGGSDTATSASFATANDAPTFTATPSISGTAAVGSLLSVINTATSDTDGDTVTLTYQWKADGSNIAGATGASFMPTADQAHATISVTVTADDGHGGSVPVTTAGVTMANTGPGFIATPAISGTAAVGSTLSIINTATSDADGDTTTLSYQWQAGGIDIAGATGAIFTPTVDQAHALITVTVTGDDGNGGIISATSAGVTVANTDPGFTATPSINGTAAVGSLLSVINTATSDVDGDTTTLSYQWQANGADIAGATSASFTPTADQAHTSITVTVTTEDGNGGSASTTSAGVTVANADPSFNATPTISGTAAVGSLLSVTNTATSDVDGDTTTLSYQWKANGADIAGATGASFTPTADQAHATISVTVTGDDGNGGSTSATSAGVTMANADPGFIATPAISGTATVGSMLSVINTATSDADGDTTTLSYQWEAGGVDIAGATSASFTPTADQAHAAITVTVTGDDGNGGTVSTTSAGVTVANSDPTFVATPSISGTAAVGSSLSVINTATSDVDGDTTTLSYQWQANGVDIAGATGTSFTPTADQAHATITVTVTGDDGNSGSVSATSAGVTMANADPTFVATPSISGTAAVGSSLSVINTATSDADGDATTLSYQWKAGGVNIAGATGASFIPTSDQAHASISVTVTADDGNSGSASATSAGVTMTNTDPGFTATPTISGIAAVGSILSVINTATTDADGDSSTLGYQWKAGGVDIAGATGVSFTPTADQAHASITVTVTADDGNGGSTSATSTGVTVANADPTFVATPTISGAAAVGSTLNVINTATNDVDGDTTTLTYQWHADGSNIVGATGETFTPTADQAHALITVTVTTYDAHGGSTPVTTAGTTVANTNPGFNATPTISGTAAVGSLLNVINTATSDVDGDSTTLSYQWQANGVDIAGATGTGFTPTADQAHASISVTVTADDGNGGSASASSAGVTMANADPDFTDTPTISGLAAVGSTLNVINTATTDADGDTTTLSYQWKANGVDVAGATGASFTPTSDQAHASISVTVTGDDGNGGSTSATSTGVMMANADPGFTATPTISGIAAVGSILSVINTATSDIDGDSTSLSYQWQANGVDIAGATGASFSPTADQAHAAITVTVTADDGNGGSASATSAGVMMANTEPGFNATPGISGTAAVGSTLNAINTATSDADGDTTTLSYQWQANGADIAGATGASFSPTITEAHAAITVTVTADDGNGGSTAATSTGVTVANINPVFTATPGINGTAAVGSLLNVTNTATTDADGDTVILAYQWQADGSNIAGATGASFTPTADQAHALITVTVTGNDGNGGSASVSSAGVTVANSTPMFTTTPSISGSAVLGSVLSIINTATTDADGDAITLSYQWQADGVDIAGAAGDTYTPTPDQSHAAITVIVTANDGNGGTDTVTTGSLTIGNNSPTFTATPTISGPAAVGSTLSAINTATSDDDGDTVGLSYQWKANGANITGATGASFIPTAAEAHALITVTVTADDGNGGTAIASSSGVTIANNDPFFVDSPTISGSAAVGSSLNAINTATNDIDGDSIALSYQWQANGVDIAGATGASFTPTPAQAHASITVNITGADGYGGSTPTVTTSAVLVADSSPIFIATPSITGSATLGSSLGVINTATTDADGDTVVLAYQWQADGSNIAGATGASFSPTAAEAHAAITVSVAANDGYGGITVANSAGVTVANNAPGFDSTPTISGTEIVGSTLSANAITTDIDGDTVTLTYQWQADGVDIPGAKGKGMTFTPMAAQAHAEITVTVTGNDGHGGITTATSTGVTMANSSPVFEATPSITGSTTSGSTLSLMDTATIDIDGDTVSLSYQWQKNGVDIEGATLETYEVINSDRGGKISTVITADDGNGSAVIVSTEEVAIPAAPGSDSGATSWLSGLMGLLLMAGRRLSGRSKRRD